MKHRRRIIVAGSRTFQDYAFMRAMLDVLLSSDEQVEIVSGGAKGADTFGEIYAKDNAHKVKQFPADWDKHGKSAGHLRNDEMSRYADEAIVFWDGKSTGTRSMIDIMLRRQKPVHVYFF